MTTAAMDSAYTYGTFVYPTAFASFCHVSLLHMSDTTARPVRMASTGKSLTQVSAIFSNDAMPTCAWAFDVIAIGK